MKIEKAHIDDHEILSEIAFKGKSYWNYGEEQLEAWRDNLTISKDYIKENKVYKLVELDKTIGFYSLILIDKSTIKIDFLFMFPEFIGKGIGKFLLESSIETAKKMKIKRIVLDADPNAEAFYKHFGFVTYEKMESSIKNRFLPKMELIIP
ncbi:Acetyltransferase (GNAT) domain-containing protein [Soonwooa buanensis]|uniref:Acetyltransferase (GNAT) domain-containing protein n=1 Tax=Soonwooa buanensis TaxID=619805 RepID=A0A1T5GUZ7_9FLAO|nr:GNAT family N-acetyltransferase [Soonwooa buanensis]SKC12216.1 Acetyltransferase (GNAT) domain-containing protein [Soonwooa buanensis]